MTSGEGTAPRPSVWLKLAHGSGAAAFGIKNGGFDYFLLLFYGTVVGLEPGLVGLAILIALVIDAISDPLVGFTSQGARLGQGGGHYDRWLADHPDTVAIGLAWDCQLVDALPVEPHDIPLTAIITPTRIYGPFA